MLTASTCFWVVAFLAGVVNSIAETLAADQAAASGLQVQADGTLSSSLLRREQPERAAALSEELNSNMGDVKTSNEEVVDAETSSVNFEASRDDEASKDEATASATASVNVTSSDITAWTAKSIGSANHRQELETEAASQANTTFYYTLVEKSKRCKKNTEGYKTNVGNYQTEACFNYVVNDKSCGRYFHYGTVDGVCDCVPAADACTREDANYYNVYWIQKMGPEAL